MPTVKEPPGVRVNRAGVAFLRGCRTLRLPVTGLISAVAPMFLDSEDFEPDVADPEAFADVTALNARRMHSNPGKYLRTWAKAVRDMPWAETCREREGVRIRYRCGA